MTIIHIVLFKLSPSLKVAEVDRFCADFLAMKNKCVWPDSDRPYIISATGGKDNSEEGAQRGFTHAFVLEFVNTQDRDYYVWTDKAHQAFKDSIEGKYEDGCVIDYEVGVY